MEKKQAECPIFGDCDDKTLSSWDKNMKEESGGVCTALLTEKALITDQVGSRQGRSSRKVKNAFELFPQEIWEMMLEEIDDSRDIVSVLRGIPQLDISVGSSHKRFWYIGAILSNLFGFIGQKDVLNLRLVCKDWQRRVDNFLPNQPYFRAYSEKLHKDYPDFWKFTHKYIYYKDKQQFFYNSGVFDYGGPFISADVDFEEESSLIMDEALEHPRNRNPFVFRAIDLNIYEMFGEENEGYNLQLQKMLSFLEQFGSHLWYLHIRLGLSNKLEITNVIKMLESTPNLKRLSLEVIDVQGEIKENAPYNNAKLLEKSLPELPFLESLQVISDTAGTEQTALEVSAGLMMRYGAQIRRLETPLNRYKLEFKELFPQLTELELYYFCHDGEYFKPYNYDMSAFQNLLLTVSAPNLVKIKFLTCPPKDIAFSFQGDIFKWLKRFPKIKYFEIECEDRNNINHFEDKLQLAGDPIKDCIPSLQTLKMVDGHGLSYDFLRCFPALRHLEMQCFCEPTVVDFSIPDSSIKLREQLQTAKLYESNIWEYLPKLRTISLVPGYLGKLRYYPCYYFNRDTYEKLKKFGRIPLEPQLHVYRKDIQDFLVIVKEYQSDSEDSSDDEEEVKKDPSDSQDTSDKEENEMEHQSYSEDSSSDEDEEEMKEYQSDSEDSSDDEEEVKKDPSDLQDTSDDGKEETEHQSDSQDSANEDEEKVKEDPSDSEDSSDDRDDESVSDESQPE